MATAEAFANLADLHERMGRELAVDERARAEALLSDASAMLRALVDVDGEDEDQAALLKMVACNMVIRSIGAGGAQALDAYGVSQASMTAGPYTQSWSFANPSGDMYLTKTEKGLLGVGSGYIGTIRPMMGGEHDD